VLPADRRRGDHGLKSRHPLLGDLSQIVGHFFGEPPCRSCPLGEVVAQVIEGEILDHCPLLPAALRLERAEPIVDAFFGQALTALGGKHIGSLAVTAGLQVGIERLAGLVQQIDIPPLAPTLQSIPSRYVLCQYIFSTVSMKRKYIFYRKDGFARISNFIERLHEKQYDSQNIEDARYKTHDDRADGHSKYTP
jgi:hypothetical protein